MPTCRGSPCQPPPRGEEGVEAHGGARGDGQVRQQTHQDAADTGDEAGGNEHGLGVMPAAERICGLTKTM